MKICIITTREISTSARVFYTQANSLAKKYDLTLIAKNKTGIKQKNMKIISLKNTKSRFARFFLLSFKAFNSARKENPKIIHFHEPEFIPYALLLKLITKAKIIYDCHENYKEKLQNKEWISFFLRNTVSYIFDKFEKQIIKFFDYVLVADKINYNNFKKYKREIGFIGNFPPILKERKKQLLSEKIAKCIYVGSLSKERGLFKIAEAIKYVQNNAKLVLLGNFEYEKDKKIILTNKKIVYLGEKNWIETQKEITKCDIGLNLLQDVPAYINSGENTTKVFEYMANSIPVISSNFPKLKEIIEKNKCGLCINPENQEEIAKTISFLISNREKARQMGKNGRKAVLKKYNWINEEKNLLNVYKNLENKQNAI